MFAITANRLTDGRVVYLAGAGWAPGLTAARRFETAELAEAALSAADPDGLEVVSPYLIEVAEAEPAGAKRVREAIRLNGPTTGSSLRAAAEFA